MVAWPLWLALTLPDPANSMCGQVNGETNLSIILPYKLPLAKQQRCCQLPVLQNEK